MGVGVTVPSSVIVGATGVPGSLVVRNVSYSGPGESNYETDSFQVGEITLIPSCGAQVLGTSCPMASVDPGVIVPEPLTGTGRAATACAGRSFAITLIDPVQGAYRFTPDTAVILGAATGPPLAATCAIDFRSHVLKAPTIDADTDAGLQTGQAASVAAMAVTPGSPIFGLTTGSIGAAQTTVARAIAALTTRASAPMGLGTGSLTDTASLAGLVAPVTTGAGVATVEFRLYGPDDATCATAIFTSPNRPLTFGGAGAASAVSEAFTPTVAGTYRWRAFFSGDANNAALTGECGAPNESVVVSGPPPAAPPPPPPPQPPPPPPPHPPTTASLVGPPPAPPVTTCAGKRATIMADGATITGTAGADVIVGGDGSSRIDGRGGDDTICGGGGDDAVRGGAGDDDLRGEGGSDLLLGGAGDDDIRGGAGRDRTGGGTGRDRIDGGAGADDLDEQAYGGGGRDQLIGGTGIDRVRTADSTLDTINCGAGADILTMDPRDIQMNCERVRRARRFAV